MGLEWCRMLEGGWNKDSAAPLSAAAAEAAWEEPGDDEDLEEKDDVEVATADDAGALLKAVKERLARNAQSSKYHDFLTAISSSVVNVEAALVILAGHDDLIASFDKCFGTPSPTVEQSAGRMDEDLGSGATDRRSPAARASQLVNLVFAGKSGRLAERAKMLEYVKTRGKQSAFPRRLFILRGTAGAGGVAWAMDSLRKEVDITGSSSVAQLAHVCSTNDFFTSFVGPSLSQPRYTFDSKKLLANSVANEARVRLAMEAGLEPLYIANACMTLWDMRPYTLLADRMGYVVTVVSPEEICPAWNDVDFLLSRSEEKLSRENLEAAIADFEELPSGVDPRPPIRAARRPEQEADSEAAAASSSRVLAPSAMLYKLEKLMLEGSNLMRFTPPEGKGWGVNGEVDGDWHSFKALADDTCTYEEGAICWLIEDPEKAWTFEGLTLLEDLRIQAFQLEEANLPTAVSHPGLFVSNSQQAAPPAPRTPPAAPSTPPRERQSSPRPPSHPPPRAAQMAPEVDAVPPAEAPSVPVSRKERMQQRVRQQLHMVKEEKMEQVAPPGKRRRAGPEAPRSAPPWSVKQEPDSAPLTKGPQAPSEPPPGRTRVKQELGGSTPAKPALAVKTEFGGRVKSEVKTEDMPRPPGYDPNCKRVVSVGDDSDEDVMDEATITAAVSKGRDECIAQLAKTIFRKERSSREGVRQRFDMVRYATRRAAKPRFPRELFILRGPPGIGKTEYAMQQLNDHVDVEPSEELAARLTHICATDDFFEMFKGDSPEYKFEASKLETQQLRNQARVRLAMEAGIHPLYIDAPNMRLWEMRPYLALAERLGYVTTVMEPIEISEKWDDIDFMAPANDTLERREMGKVISRDMLAGFISAFEPLPEGGDPLAAVQSARQGGSPAVVESVSGHHISKARPTGRIPAFLQGKKRSR